MATLHVRPTYMLDPIRRSWFGRRRRVEVLAIHWDTTLTDDGGHRLRVKSIGRENGGVPVRVVFQQVPVRTVDAEPDL